MLPAVGNPGVPALARPAPGLVRVLAVAGGDSQVAVDDTELDLTLSFALDAHHAFGGLGEGPADGFGRHCGDNCKPVPALYGSIRWVIHTRHRVAVSAMAQPFTRITINYSSGGR